MKFYQNMDYAKIEKRWQLMLRIDLNSFAPEQHLCKIRILNLRQNFIRHLPPALSKLTNLEVLVLNENNIQDLSASLGRITTLNYLDISSNPINALNPSLCRLTRLRVLNIMNTNVTKLHPHFSAWKNIEELFLNKHVRALPITMRSAVLLESVITQKSNTKLKISDNVHAILCKEYYKMVCLLESLEYMRILPYDLRRFYLIPEFVMTFSITF
jgi:Leucine-rich repeat (LRR) protein